MAIVGNKTYQSDSFNLGGDKRMEFILAADKENPDYFGGQYLLYYWVMFEVQFRLTKAEKKIWEQGLEEFMQYVYGKLAILQAGS